ncbi:hypothetical protein DSECCO2_427330 [anaerobic digester metagenome]
MERLTVKRNGVWHFEDWERGIDCTGKAIDHLAAYEDTGLEPEDMKRAFNDDAVLKLAGQALGTTAEHLRNLLSIEKDGRLVVLQKPANVGWKKPTCFRANEDGTGSCAGIYCGEDDLPIHNCQKCWFCGWFCAEAEAALRGEEDG